MRSHCRRLMVPCVFWAILLVAGCASGPRIPEPPSDIGITPIVVDTNQPSRLPPGFFGLDAGIADLPVSFDNTGLRREVRRCKPGSLLFPAGDIANFWDWRVGLGRIDWIEGLGKADAALRGQAGDRFSELLRKARFNLKKGGSQFSSFIELCRETAGEPYCTVNVLYQSPDDTAAWRENSQLLQLPVTHWLLGWEPWKPKYRAALSSPLDYIRQARKHAEALLNSELSVQVAVPAPPATPPERMAAPEQGAEDASTTKTAKAEAAFLADWTRELAGEDFYNAVAMNLEYDVPMDAPERPDALHFELMSNLEFWAEDAIERTAEAFDNRPIWITRWGLSLGPDRADLRESMLEALALADMAAVLGGQAPGVALACYGPAARSLEPRNAFETARKIASEFASEAKPAHPKRLHLEYEPEPLTRYALQLLGGFYASADEVVAMDFYRPPRVTPENRAISIETERKKSTAAEKPLPMALKGIAVRDKDGAISVLAVNRSGSSLPVRLVVDRHSVESKVRGRSLWARSLLVKNEPRSAEKGVRGDEIVHPRNYNWPGDQIILPPYSITILKP